MALSNDWVIKAVNWTRERSAAGIRFVTPPALMQVIPCTRNEAILLFYILEEKNLIEPHPSIICGTCGETTDLKSRASSLIEEEVKSLKNTKCEHCGHQFGTDPEVRLVYFFHESRSESKNSAAYPPPPNPAFRESDENSAPVYQYSI